MVHSSVTESINPLDPVAGSGQISRNTAGARGRFEEAATRALPCTLRSTGTFTPAHATLKHATLQHAAI